MSAPCLYTVTGWGVMSCVCGMAFLCGSTLVKVPLLQAGTVVMLKSDIKPKQTNKQTIFKNKIYHCLKFTPPSLMRYGLLQTRTLDRNVSMLVFKM